MSKFHINKHGVPAPCKAKEGNCPLGGNETHFKSIEEAQEYVDKENEKDYGIMPNMKESKPMTAKEKAKLKKEQKERLASKLKAYWNDDKMVNHELKNSNYVEIGDSFVDLGDSKPKIQREILFDDETEAPEINYENFYNYNVRFNMPKRIKKEGTHVTGERGTLKIVPKYSGQETLDLAMLTYENNPDGEYKEITDEELGELNKGIDEVRKNYDKRLKTYYKRYKDKIVSKGYWANR